MIMKSSGPDFYDKLEVFNIYTEHRSRAESPNESMEQPIVWELIGCPRGLEVLDLGCGDARVAKKFKQLSALKYVGVEGSSRMIASATQNIEGPFSQVIHARLEDFEPREVSFDLVVSSLALHYVSDLSAIMVRVKNCLRTGGRFIFSVEHPIITSCNKALENSDIRQAWIVDNYFQRGERTVQWMGDTVTKYHRTTEDFLNELKRVGLQLKNFREAEPHRSHFQDAELWQRRMRIPLFLIVEAVKT